MTTGANQVAAAQMRQRIPTEWIVQFQDWTAEALQSLASDAGVRPEMRAYAGWELDYRLAFDVQDAPDPVLDAWIAAGRPRNTRRA